MGRRRVTVRALLAVCLLALTACGLTPASESRSPSSVVVDIVNYPATLDPARQYDTDSYTVYRNIFDQLLHRDPRTNEVVPWLATAWTQVDPTTWRFTLRDDVRFSDGTPLRADDAAYSLNRILDKQFGSEQLSNFSAVAEASADGDDTLVVRTKAPSPTLLSYLTTLSVVPRAYVERVGDERFNEAPVGSGPYALAGATNGSEVRLEPNPYWWGPEPDVRTAVFRSVPNIASRVADLQAGKADLITALTPDAAGEVERDPRLQVLSTPTERVAYVAFNTINGGAVEDVDVRRAIALAINYRALIRSLQLGEAKPVNSVLTPLATGYPQALPDSRYDPDEARRIIEKAGARGATVVMATSPSFNPQIVQAIQANLADVGLTVKIEATDQPTYLKKVQDPAHRWGGMRFGKWSCACLDADGVVYPLFRTGTIWSSWSNPTFDGLVDDARDELDTAARDRLYAQAFQILARDVPGIGLFQDYAVYGAAERVRWTPNAQEQLFLADVRLRP
ncbi:ABC transporter substrate-binding protein [Solicola sp. PLA-1-18]|uniref:ABC transporter substrate-binding protein n=1 Tax=Solicola sp. PLA-1-18 TaxID=3380532 RepID=UPI003B82255A